MENRFTHFVESFLNFSIATSFIMSILIAILMQTQNDNECSKILIDWFTFLITFVSGLLYTVVLAIFSDEKTKIGSHIRFMFIYLIFICLLCFLIGKHNLLYILIPTTIAHYILEAVMNEVYVYHREFTDSFDGKTGKDLKTHLYHNNIPAIDFAAKLKSIQMFESVIAVLMFILIIALKNINNDLPPSFVFCALFFYFCIFCTFYLFGYYKNQSYYAFLGFDKIIEDKKKNFKAIMLIFFISVGFAFVASSNNALIKVEFHEPVFESRQEQHVEMKTPNFIQFDFESLPIPDTTKNHKDYSWLFSISFQIIKWTVIGVFAILLIVFMFKPFFSDEWKKYWAENKLFDFIKKTVLKIKDFFHYLFKKNADKKQCIKVDERNFQKEIKDFIKKTARSKEKTTELDRLTKLFIKLIEYGASNGIEYKKNLAPAEYTELFNNCDADIAGSIFEKALYDKNLLTNDEEKLFRQCVKKTIATKIQETK